MSRGRIEIEIEDDAEETEIKDFLAQVTSESDEKFLKMHILMTRVSALANFNLDDMAEDEEEQLSGVRLQEKREAKQRAEDLEAQNRALKEIIEGLNSERSQLVTQVKELQEKIVANEGLTLQEPAGRRHLSLQDPPWSFRKGDIVWAKVAKFPWWPGKVADSSDIGADCRVKVVWYQCKLPSLVHISMLLPFQKFYKSKYDRKRKRNKAAYHRAVRDALAEAAQLQSRKVGVKQSLDLTEL